MASQLCPEILGTSWHPGAGEIDKAGCHYGTIERAELPVNHHGPTMIIHDQAFPDPLVILIHFWDTKQDKQAGHVKLC